MCVLSLGLFTLFTLKLQELLNSFVVQYVKLFFYGSGFGVISKALCLTKGPTDFSPVVFS